jgi:hemerythrin-like domain-containing protein
MKITDALKTEHTIFLTVFDQIERMLPRLATLSEIRLVASMVEALLQGHASRETNLAYMALDHVMAESGQLNRMHEDHREFDDRLGQIQAAKSGAEARRLLKAVLGGCREHFKMEERHVFPLLETTLQPETLLTLGRSWLELHRAPAEVS